MEDEKTSFERDENTAKGGENRLITRRMLKYVRNTHVIC